MYLKHWIDGVLWIGGLGLQLGIVLMMLRRKLRAEFPFFFHYNVFQALSCFGLFFLYRPDTVEQYFYAYWASSAVSALLGFAVIHEVFKNAFKPYEALRDFSGIMFRWAALVLVLVATLLAFASHGADSPYIVAILATERGVLVMQSGLLLFLLLFSSRLGLTWKHHGFGVSLGFGLYASLYLITNSLRSQMGQSWEPVYAVMQSACYVGALVIWTSYVVSPEPARVAVVTAFEPKPVLQRWNQVLRGDQVIADGAFLSSMEKIVDHVISAQK